MPENFQAEQSKISAVEKKAGEMKEGKKTHEELAAELQAKHDVFFKQVDSTAKTFQEAEKLKDPAAKTELGKDKQEIKDLILKAAQSGENILAKTETGFTTIRQSAERISKLTTTVADNLKFFQDMDTAKELLTGSDSWLKKAQSYEGNGEKPTGWQSEYVVSLDMGLTNLDALSSAILSKYTSFSSPELKAVYDAIKKQADTNMLLLTESRMRFLKNFPDKMNTYIDDEGNEKQVTPEQKATIAKIQSIREKGSINGQKEGAEGYTGMMLLVENGKVQITNAAGEKDEQKKQVFLDSAKDEFTRVKAIATQITPELSSIAEEVKTLPPSFRAIYNIMVNNTASASAEAGVQLGKLEKGRALVSGKDVVDEVEKLYDDSSENCAKKKFEAALAERNKLTLDPKYQEKLNNYSKLAGVGELKADPDANEKKDDVLHDRELFKSIDTGLTALCALSGKMQAVDRATLNREDQVHFDQLKGKIDAQIAELNQIKLGLQSYHLAASIGERYREPGKEAPKYFTFVTKTVNGVQVTAMVPTEEFLKLPKDKQDAISDEFMSLQASSKLDNERKKELPEDKDWKEGMSQFEKGNWQGAKKLLLAYMQRFQADPEKAVQIQSTRGILQGIIQKEMGDVKDRIYMMQQEYGSGFTAENTNHIAMYGEMGKAWKKFAEAESAANSGKYLTIEEVWDKVGKLPNFTKSGIDWMDQKSIQIMLSEPDPVKRKENIRNLGKWANEAGLKSFAKMYYNMYFEEELQAKKKSPDCIKLQQEALAKYDKEDHTKEIEAAMKSAHEAERTKFITYINQTRGFGSVGQDAANQKIFDDYDAKYESQDKSAIRTQIAAGMRQDVVDKVTKQALHADMMATDNVDPNSASGVWKEAYGGTFNVVENINDKFFVTEDDVRMWATKWAIKIEALALATAMGMMTGGAAAAFAGEMGLAAGVFGTGAVNFIVDGAVMHSTLTALTEGDAGFRDPLTFGKGLAITYATMGLMKGTGALMGRSATLGKAAEGLATATEGSLVGTAAVAVGKMGGKAAFDASLMTGFNMAVAAGGGKPMGWEDIKGTFAENMVICFVMGGMHGAIEGKVEASGKGEQKLSAAERRVIEVVQKAADADTAATRAREKANEAAKKGDKNAPLLEAEAARLEAQAKSLDALAEIGMAEAKAKAEGHEAPPPESGPKVEGSAPERVTLPDISPTGIDFATLDRPGVEKVLKSKDFKPKDLIDALKKTPEFQKLFEANSGVSEGYTIEQHTEMVMKQFEKYFAGKDLPGGMDADFMRLLLAVHDIGKPRAIEKGDKGAQHEETGPIVRELFAKLGMSPKKIDLAVSLLSGDPIGKMLQGEISRDQAMEQVAAMAQQAHLPPSEFLDALLVLYKSDTSAYTSDAGAKPSLDPLFNFDPANRKLGFSPEYDSFMGDFHKDLRVYEKKIKEAHDTLTELNEYNPQLAQSFANLDLTKPENKAALEQAKLELSFQREISKLRELHRDVATMYENLLYDGAGMAPEKLKQAIERVQKQVELQEKINKLEQYDIDLAKEYRKKARANPEEVAEALRMIDQQLEAVYSSRLEAASGRFDALKPEEIAEFEKLCGAGDKELIQYLREKNKNSPEAFDAWEKILEQSANKDNSTHLSSLDKVEMYLKIKDNIQRFERGELTDAERAISTDPAYWKSVYEESMTMLRDGQIGSDYSHGTDSRLWGGLESSGGTLLSAAELGRRGIRRQSGEGESSGATLNDAIYVGAGLDGIGTAIAYGKANRNLDGYRSPAYLDPAILSQRIARFERLVAEMDARGVTDMNDLAETQAITKAWGIDKFPGLGKHTLERELSLMREAQVAQQKGLVPPEPYQIIFSFRDPNAPAAVVERGYGTALSGERSLLASTVSLSSQLDTVYVPKANIAEARAHLERVLGPERAATVRIYSIESLDVVAGMKGPLYSKVRDTTFGALEGTQGGRMMLIDRTQLPPQAPAAPAAPKKPKPKPAAPGPMVANP